MTGWKAKAAGAVIAAALLLALAAGIAHAMFDGDYIKAIARDRVQAAWSRDLAIDTLSLRLFPAPAVHATGVTLSAPAWAQDPQMAAADVIDVQLSWRALLTGHIAPGALRVAGGRLMLERAADGRRNWALESKGQRHGAPDWRQLVRVDAERIDIQYRDGAAAPRRWQVPMFSASSAPNWQNLAFEGKVEHAQQTVALQGKLADLSRLGTAGAVTGGSVSATWPTARLQLDGSLPLSADGRNATAKVTLEAQSLDGLLHFFDITPVRPTAAPLSFEATLQGSSTVLAASRLHVRLGQTEASGALTLHRDQDRVLVDGELASPDLDWAVLTREAGRPLPPPIPENELFRHVPLAWGAIDALDGIDTRLKLHVGKLRLRSGILLSDVAAEMRSHDDTVDLPAFSMQLLGGHARGSLKLLGAKRSAQLNVDATGVLLERFFSERDRKVPVSDGPMQIKASLHGHGDSLRAMAATLGGSATVRGGAALVRSEKAGTAESLLNSMVPLLSEKRAPHVRLECFAARLPFSNGQAKNAVVGARSEVSQLITAGQVDMKRQSVELHGRVRARNGVSVGLAALTGDISISGPLRKPKMTLDPVGTPSALARLAAAVVTSGLSLVATAAWDAAHPGANPCEAVFSVKD